MVGEDVEGGVVDWSTVGDVTDSAQLIAVLYDELRALARRQMAGEPRDHTLQPTALVHEAYLRLLKSNPRWQNRAHFFAAAAEAMRRILIERARRYQRERHGGKIVRVRFDSIDSEDAGATSLEVEMQKILDLESALTDLETRYPDKAKVVKLRFFAGLNVAETGAALGIAEITVLKHWRFAKAWLQRAMSVGGA